MWTISPIRWQSAGGYAWTLDYIDGSCTQYRTDRAGYGLWEDGIQVLGTDGLDLGGCSTQTRRSRVTAYHKGRRIRSWIPGGARRLSETYRPARGMIQ